jgi:uncharacterized protein YwqG
MMVEHLQKILVRSGHERWAWPMAESSEPAIKIKTVFSDEKLIPIGVSKFGGTPHVPFDFAWPRSTAGQPMSFLAQIHFAEFIPFQWMGWKVPLPEEGLVSLFKSMVGPEEIRTFFFNNPASLVRWDDPFAIDSPVRRLLQKGQARPDDGSIHFPPRSLSFDQFLSLPEVCERARAMGQTDDEAEAYRQFAIEHNSTGGRHQMLGFAVGSKERDPGQTLLLQLDSDPLVNWSWPESTCIVITMATDDLQHCRFDHARLHVSRCS